MTLHAQALDAHIAGNARGIVAAALNGRDPRPEPPPEGDVPLRHYNLLSAADLRKLPPQRDRVQSVFPQQGVGAIYGASGGGKSFLYVGLVAAIGEGAEWFDYRSKQCRVICIVLEGRAGFPRRVQAWEADEGRPFPEAVQFIFEGFNLTQRDDVLRLAATIEAAGGAELIVIDTCSQATVGSDENSSQDSGRAVEALNMLQQMTGGLVLLIGHPGKDANKGLRGHSSVYAALDVVIEVSRTGDSREWKIQKLKDGQDGKAHPFRLKVVDLGGDEDGNPITSCVLATSDGGLDPMPPSVRLPKGGNQRIVYDALGPLFRASGAFGRGGAPMHRPCLTLDEAIAGTRERLAVEAKRRSERARQAITGLIATGVLGSNEGWLWLK